MSVNPAKKKLLFVITQGGPWGGAQRYVFDLVSQLGGIFDVTVAIGEPKNIEPLHQRLLAANISVHRLRHLRRDISPFRDLLAIRELRFLYQTLKPDIVHLNSSKAGVLGALAREKQMHTPAIIYTAHGWVFNEPLPWLMRTLYRHLERESAARRDRTIVLSPEDAHTAEHQLHIPQETTHIIPLGIDTPHFLTKHEARTAIQKYVPHLPTDGIWIGTIANFYPTKGYPTLIAALSHAQIKLPAGTQSILIGDGPQKKDILVQANTMAVKNIFFSGFIPDAASLLKAFDVFVLPSEKEGLPYTVLEALAAHIPVVATRVGGLPSLLEHKSGTELVPPHNAISLAEAITRTLDTSVAPDVFIPSLATVAAQTTSVYHQVLK